MSSVAFDKIVPFGQYFVLDDMLLTLALKERVAFFLYLIDVSVDSRKYSGPCLGSYLGRHIAGLPSLSAMLATKYLDCLSFASLRYFFSFSVTMNKVIHISHFAEVWKSP